LNPIGGGGGGGGAPPPAPPPPGGGGGGGGIPPAAGAPGGGGGGGGGAPRPDEVGGGGGGAPRPDDGGGGGGGPEVESPRPLGLCATLGDGRDGLEAMEGPVSLRMLAGEGAALGAFPGESPLDPSFGRLEANLLPVDLSFTLRGLKPNRPEAAGAGAGLGLGACFSLGDDEDVGGFLTPPIGGGGGGGGGGPPAIKKSKHLEDPTPQILP